MAILYPLIFPSAIVVSASFIVVVGVTVSEVLAESVVAAIVDGVLDPIGPGEAKVAPPRSEALRLGTTVVEAIVKGAVPVERVEVITPVALSVVAAIVDGVTPPIAPGAVQVVPLRSDVLRLGTTVVEAIVKGDVPVERVEVITPVAETVVAAMVDGVPPPIAPGEANVAPERN